MSLLTRVGDHQVIDKFISDAYEGASKLVPGSQHCMVVVTTAADFSFNSSPSQPPVDFFTSPFIGHSAQEVSQRLGSGAPFFVILDEKSLAVNTAEIVSRGTESDPVKAVRTTFGSAQNALVALEIGSLGVEELQNIAATSPAGVYGARTGNAKKGGIVPRITLGAD